MALARGRIDRAITDLHDELRAVSRDYPVDLSTFNLGYLIVIDEVVKHCNRDCYLSSDNLTKYTRYLASVMDVPFDLRVKRDLCFIRKYHVIEMTRERVHYLYMKYHQAQHSTTVHGSASL